MGGGQGGPRRHRRRPGAEGDRVWNQVSTPAKHSKGDFSAHWAAHEGTGTGRLASGVSSAPRSDCFRYSLPSLCPLFPLSRLTRSTGFGNFANVIIADDELEALQANLIRSHAAGVGMPLSPAKTRML